MKTILLMTILMSLSSCATNQSETYSTEANCSPRAKDYIRNHKDKDRGTPTDNAKVIESFTALMISKKSEMKSCYDEDMKSSGKQNYNTCLVVGTNAKGSMVFIDVEDNRNLLSMQLSRCLRDIFGNLNYQSFPHDSVFSQPIRLLTR